LCCVRTGPAFEVDDDDDDDGNDDDDDDDVSNRPIPGNIADNE